MSPIVQQASPGLVMAVVVGLQRKQERVRSQNINTFQIVPQ